MNSQTKPQRDWHGRLLPGSTANPSGRPKGSAALAAEIARRTGDGADILNFFEDRARNRTRQRDELGHQVLGEDGEPIFGPGHFTDEEQKEAMLWLADRLWGKAIMAVDMQALVLQHTVASPDTALLAFDVEQLGEDELLALDAALRLAARPRTLTPPGTGTPVLDVPGAQDEASAASAADTTA